MSIRSRWKPREKLLEIQEKCGKRRSLKQILPLISESLECTGSDFRKFSYTFNGHSWKGYVYQKRNSLMGTLFTVWDNKFYIIRGYPKIKYSHDTILMDKECIVEEKVDGTNLGLWLLPNGKLMGKTRMVERFDVQGFQGREWNVLLGKAINIENAKKLLKEDYLIFGELYGQLNSGEFIRYTTTIGFKIFDIVDRRNLGFLSFDEKMNLAQRYGLPTVNLFWRGTLTIKEVQRIEFELSSYVREDGMEGCVAKYYNLNDKDVYMAKLKCKEVTEQCWSKSHLTIPSAVIGKAIQKAMENLSKFSTKDAFEEFVIEELKEEATEELISKSKPKIKRMIEDRMTPAECQEEVFAYLKDLIKQGIDIGNKGKIMSSLADKFIGYKPSLLYRLYEQYKGKAYAI